MTVDHIKNYWESQGNKYKDSHWASWGDNWMINLEVETISKYINDGYDVLDIGCANGYSTFRQNELKNLSSITGVDYASSMVTAAQMTKNNKGLGDKINFIEGDIRSLKFPDNSFDLVYTTRVLINLPTWDQQLAGISECIRVVKPNGSIILSEGFWEPLILLNSVRCLLRLSPLVEHDFNKYLKFSVLEKHLKKLELEYEIDDFSSIYYLGSRILRELVTESDKYEGFTNPINKIFYEIQKQFSGGGMGVQQAVIIKKN
jgi:ubiquinone/menaquinone biosynthesis C-methylase UbiE